MEDFVCTICRQRLNSAVDKQVDNNRVWDIDCMRCGAYSINEEVLSGVTKHLEADERSSIMRALRNGSDMKDKKLLTPESIKKLSKRQKMNILRIADEILKYISKVTPIGKKFKYFDDSEHMHYLMGKIGTFDRLEVESYIQALIDKKYLQGALGLSNEISITFNGYNYLSSLGNGIKTSKSLCIMPEDERYDNVWFKAIKPAMEFAGGNAFRLEKSNGISNEAIHAINQSDFLVVDFSTQSNELFFQVGYARGIGKEVYFCCHEDSDIPHEFNFSGYSFLIWDFSGIEDFGVRLNKMITSGRKDISVIGSKSKSFSCQ